MTWRQTVPACERVVKRFHVRRHVQPEKNNAPRCTLLSLALDITSVCTHLGVHISHMRNKVGIKFASAYPGVFGLLLGGLKDDSVRSDLSFFGELKGVRVRGAGEKMVRCVHNH